MASRSTLVVIRLVNARLGLEHNPGLSLADRRLIVARSNVGAPDNPGQQVGASDRSRKKRLSGGRAVRQGVKLPLRDPAPGKRLAPEAGYGADVTGAD